MSGNDKRLLMVSTVSGTLSGFVLPVVERMRECGWAVDGAAQGIEEAPACVEAFDSVYDIDWSRNPLDPANISHAVRRIREVVEGGGHSVIHVHTPVAAFVTRLALRDMRAEIGCRVIYTAHGFHFHERNSSVKNAAFLMLEKVAGQWTDRLVLINEYDVEQAEKHRIVPPHRITYMHGIGVDTDKFNPEHVPDDATQHIREELGLESEPLFLVPAEFIPRKRQHLIVEALAAAHRGDLHVAFVGTGPTQAAVRQKARRLGLAERTHFLGYRSDMPELIKAADATVLYSNQEGLSRAVLESLSMERPVIGSDIRGIRELLADGCGVPVDPDRTDRLARAMELAAEDREWLEYMGRRGRRKVSGPYEERRIVAEHEVMYEDVYAQL